MPDRQPDPFEELRQSALEDARSSLRLTELIIGLLDQGQGSTERPGQCRLRALPTRRTAS